MNVVKENTLETLEGDEDTYFQRVVYDMRQDDTDSAETNQKYLNFNQNQDDSYAMDPNNNKSPSLIQRFTNLLLMRNTDPQEENPNDNDFKKPSENVSS